MTLQFSYNLTTCEQLHPAMYFYCTAIRSVLYFLSPQQEEPSAPHETRRAALAPPIAFGSLWRLSEAKGAWTVE
jgi:hypothetical protein